VVVEDIRAPVALPAVLRPLMHVGIANAAPKFEIRPVEFLAFLLKPRLLEYRCVRWVSSGSFESVVEDKNLNCSHRGNGCGEQDIIVVRVSGHQKDEEARYLEEDVDVRKDLKRMQRPFEAVVVPFFPLSFTHIIKRIMKKTSEKNLIESLLPRQ